MSYQRYYDFAVGVSLEFYVPEAGPKPYMIVDLAVDRKDDLLVLTYQRLSAGIWGSA
jgi:hypothetical protein